MTEANPRPCVEREEDKWVRDEVLLHPLIQETAWVEFQGYSACCQCLSSRKKVPWLPSGPHRSVLRCIENTEYKHLVPAGTKKGRPPCGAGQIKSSVAFRTLNGLENVRNQGPGGKHAESNYTEGNNLSVSGGKYDQSKVPVPCSFVGHTVYRRAKVFQFSQVFVCGTGARANLIEDLLSQPLQHMRLLRKHIQHERES